jgi:hypothetical protein
VLCENSTSEHAVDVQMIESVIDSCKEKACVEYYPLFLSKAEESDSNGKRELSELFALLGALCSLKLDLESKDEPYKPIMQMFYSRSASLDDFTSQDLKVMKEVLTKITDAELKARIGDILWVLRKDHEAARDRSIKLAETYVTQAEQLASSSSPNYLAASCFLWKSIEAFRQIGNTKDRITDLHGRLIEYQQQSISELEEVRSAEIEIMEHVKEARKRVAGKTLLEALLALAFISGFPSLAELNASVEEMAGEYVFQHLLHEVVINEYGRTIARKPSSLSQDPKEKEAALRAEMYKLAAKQRSLIVRCLISPARKQIMLEHGVQVSDLRPLVYHNLFIPAGREEIYAQGLYYGLVGEFMFATHLLIPQFENAIRKWLYKSGEIASGLDAEGIQDEKNLNSLLYSSTLKNIIGEDLLFDLQGLLVERFGNNLRNRLAHGLIDYSSFCSDETEYFWWIVLRFCFLAWGIQQQLEKQVQQMIQDKCIDENN